MDQELAEAIIKNTRRYVTIFSEAVAELLPVYKQRERWGHDHVTWLGPCVIWPGPPWSGHMIWPATIIGSHDLAIELWLCHMTLIVSAVSLHQTMMRCLYHGHVTWPQSHDPVALGDGQRFSGCVHWATLDVAAAAKRGRTTTKPQEHLPTWPDTKIMSFKKKFKISKSIESWLRGWTLTYPTALVIWPPEI